MSSRKRPIEAERAVLGSCLLDPHAVTIARDNLLTADFTDPKHALLWQIITILHADKQPIDEVTVCTMLQRTGELADAGGTSYVASLTDETPTAANVSAYCELLRKAAGVRALYKAAHDAAKAIENGAEVDDIWQQLDVVRTRIDSREPSTLVDLHVDTGELLREMDQRERGDVIVGAAEYIPTRIKPIDDVIVGLERGGLHIISARPRTGKTSLAICIADNVVADGHRVLMFSREMSARQVTRRSLAERASVYASKLKSGTFNADDWSRATAAWGAVQRERFLIDETTTSLRGLRATAHRVHRKKPVALIVVDYLQLFAPNGGDINKEQEVGAVARELKDLAKELRVAVVALAQPKAEVDDKPDARATGRSASRDSDQIFQTADVFFFMKRPALWNAKADPKLTIMETIKVREGEPKDFELTWHGEYQRFDDAPRVQYIANQARSWMDTDKD